MFLLINAVKMRRYYFIFFGRKASKSFGSHDYK